MAEPTIKKQRLQSGKACESCRQKKHRCDAARPRCSNCKIRAIPCRYTDAQAGQSAVTDKVENKVESDARDGQLIHKHASNSATLEPKRSFPSEFELTYAIDPQILPKNRAATESIAVQAYLDDSSTFAAVLDGSSHGFHESLSREHSGSSLCMQESTGSYTNFGVLSSFESCFDLPDRVFADSLVDAYFKRIHKLYPFLHEGSFRAEYENMWENAPFSRDDSHLSWFGVLNMVFAHGCEFCGTIKHEDILGIASTFVARSKNLILSHIFRTSTLATVQSLLLMCYYLQGTADVEVSWTLVGLMIRTAIGLSLHVNPSTEQHLTIERELRKRAWWGCFVIDRTLSMKFGRPPTLRVEEGNVDLPLQVDDQYITNDSSEPRQPINTPSFTSFFVATIGLAHIVYNMSTTLHLHDREKSNSSSNMNLSTLSARYNHMLSKVVLLDGQLQSWWEDAPAHLTQEPTYGDEGLLHFQSQRTLLKIRYLHIRLLLHRQSFLAISRDQISSDFCRSIAVSSAQICVDSACQTVKLISRSYPRQQLNSLWYNTQYIFTSMCILCNIQKLDQDKRSLLLAQPSQTTEVEACHSTGLTFLKSASTSSVLAARYVALLQQIHEDDGHGHNHDIAVAANVEVESVPAAAGDTKQVSCLQDLSGLTNDWNFSLDAPDLFSGVEINFEQVYDSLVGTGTPADTFTGPTGDQFTLSYVSW